MTDRVFHGAVRNGQIFLETPQTFAQLKAGFEGQQIDLTLKKRRNKRTNPQNRYYWGVVVKILGEHCGYDSDEMHEALKQQFLKIHEDTALPTVRSSAKLNTIEFTEYIEQCRRLAAEMGVYIPDPNEVDYNEMEAA